jgi:hypothetical protein
MGEVEGDCKITRDEGEEVEDADSVEQDADSGE